MPELETLDGQVLPPVQDAPGPGAQDSQAPPPRPPGPATADRPKRAYNRRQPKAEQARVVTRTATPLGDDERTEGVKAFVQIGAGMALLAGKVTGKDSFKADAVTIAGAADDTAAACVQLAHTDPKFAVALDKVCAAGPYAALITIAVGVGTQVARNHKPGLAIPGTVHPDELLKNLEQEKETADV